MSAPVRAFAPAKINLTLHVTGQRSDGYHLLSSLVAFADVGDDLTVTPNDTLLLTVTGPRARDVPVDPGNLCWQAAERFGTPVVMQLDKHLPTAAGIGGGSSDAAAVLRALIALEGRAPDFDTAELGADVPVCMVAKASIMEGVGEVVTPVSLPPIPAVLVNPGVAVSTPSVFRALPSKDNPGMPAIPSAPSLPALLDWLSEQRNDLEAPACGLQPVISEALEALAPARLARMSGSGATCFGLCSTREQADQLARSIAADHEAWWVQSCTLS